MTDHEQLRTRATAAYNAAADSYDAPANTFWDRFGRRTVERLRLQPGMRILDVCAGSGASAIPAAEAVGPSGRVVTIDLAADLCGLLRAKAASRGLAHVEARTGDFFDLDVPGAVFDAVICIFGLFFFNDRARAVRQMWHGVAPGGQLAITTWGPRVFEPGNARFWTAVRAERPDLYRSFNPWDSLTDPETLRAVLIDGGVPDADIVAESGTHPIPSAEAWWALVMGTGYRGTIEQLSPEVQARVRRDNLEYIADANITCVETNDVYAVAVKRPAD